jgi:hypothetical protein
MFRPGLNDGFGYWITGGRTRDSRAFDGNGRANVRNSACWFTQKAWWNGKQFSERFTRMNPDPKKV